MELEALLKEIVERNRPLTDKGVVAHYIPELDKARKDALGIVIKAVNGKEYYYGDCDTRFTIQSISKIITLMLAMLDNGEEKVFSKVGMEPSGDPFNSIQKLETSLSKKPCNPLINAGAIAMASMIKGPDERARFERLLEFARKVTEDPSIDVNYKIYCGEKETGFTNWAMGYYLKGDGVIEGNVPAALDVYFKQCSMEVTAHTIAQLGLFLANDGVLSTGERVITPRLARIVKTLMVTCGMYDESGEFAVRVGIPSKSGVGGGIMSVVPRKMGIGVYGPSLDHKGNSLAGIAVLEDLEQAIDLSVF
ncbi:MAG: glutaminase A [Acidaminococcaceae bacterium]|jgi:glutaminase|nr:glutaminase A [Acidaminococcaceae bacterium]